MRFTIGRTRLLGVLAVGLALGAGVTQAQQQSGTISGTVTDRISNAPLSSVRVSALGTNRSVLTNQQGRYTLAGVPAGTYQVQAAIIGYGAATNTAAVVAGQSETVDFGLRPAAVSLDAVTVTTPAGEQRARESGNATINIDLPKQIENQGTATLADALSGKGVGVQVLQSGGTVGTGTRIRIRGQTSLSLSNEPVYYVDGVRVESGDVSLSVGTGGQAPSRINDINPQDIANVEVVKGPAASTLYGTKAANGVIRITTKHGVAGPARWRIYTEGGMLNDKNQYPVNFFSWGHTATTPVRQCTLLQSVAAAGACTIDSMTSYSVLMDPKQTPIGTGYRGQGGLQVQGGTDQIQYYLSGDYQDQLGVYRLSDVEYSRLTAAGAGTAPSYEVFRPNEVKQTSLRSNIHALPTPQHISRVTGSLSGNWRPTTFLTWRANVGMDYTGRNDIQFQPRGQGPNFSNFRLGRRSDNRFTIFHYTADLGGTGQFNIMPTLNSKTSIGVQYLKDNFFGVRANGQNLPPGGSAITGAAIRTASEETTLAVTVGTYVEETLGWRDRVFLTGAIRRDRNSTFGSKARSVNYPKLQGSWVLSEESFYPRALPFSNLKLRFAYGASGQQPGSTDALLFYAAQTATLFNGATATDLPGIDLTAFGNAGLKPEWSSEIELGFDAGVFKDAGRLELTYYNKRTKDALINRRLPPSNGIAT